jgi:hypothetical protein
VIYTVHSKADPLSSLAALDGTRFVKDGFSWPAFVFTLVWLLAKRMWVVLALAIAAQILLSAFASFVGAPWWFGALISPLTALLLGFEGNALYRWSLARRGYVERGLVQAHRIEDAEARHFGR